MRALFVLMLAAACGTGAANGATPADYFQNIDSPEYRLYSITTPDDEVLALFSDASGSFISISTDRLTAVPEPATGFTAASCVLAVAVLRKR